MVPLALEVTAGAVHDYQHKLKSNITCILEHCQEVTASLHTREELKARLEEIDRHARTAKQAFDWLDNFTVTDECGIPTEVRAALAHVQKLHPDVDRVVFWADGRWTYMTDNANVPGWGFDDVDVSILEDASNAVDKGYPRAFQLPDES